MIKFIYIQLFVDFSLYPYFFRPYIVNTFIYYDILQL